MKENALVVYSFPYRVQTAYSWCAINYERGSAHKYLRAINKDE